MSSDNLVFVGISLGVFASMSGTIGKQLMRFSELCKRRGNAYAAKVALTIGLALNTAVGPIVDMLSYMFAPQSLIAPLGGLDVVWNTLLAPCTLGEKLTPLVTFGVVLIAGGATGTSVSGNHDDKEYTVEMLQDIFIRRTVLIYLLALSAWLAFNILVLQPRSSAPKGEPWASGDPIRGLSLGLTAGSIAGNMFCVKGTIELIQVSGKNEDSAADVWGHWLVYLLGVGAVAFAVTNVVFLTKAMREYEALFMGAVFEGSLIVCAAVSGIVVFKDLEKLETHRIVIYFLSLFCLVVGIGVVAIGCWKPEEPEDQGDPEDGVTKSASNGSDPARSDSKESSGGEVTPANSKSHLVKSGKSSLSVISKKDKTFSVDVDRAHSSPFCGGGSAVASIEATFTREKTNSTVGSPISRESPSGSANGASGTSGIQFFPEEQPAVVGMQQL